MRQLSQHPAPKSPVADGQPGPGSEKVSELLEAWLDMEGEKSLGSLIDLFEEKGFAILFVVLLGIPALPLPTGGATHLFEIVAMVLALQLLVGRDKIWLPRRWRKLELAGHKQRRFIALLIRMIARLERFSRPRLRFLFGHRLSNIAFAVLVIGGSAAAFLAPPFTGLDTLPALGVVLLSLGVLLEDFVVVLAALLVGIAGVALVVALGSAAIDGLRRIV